MYIIQQEKGIRLETMESKKVSCLDNYAKVRVLAYIVIRQEIELNEHNGPVSLSHGPLLLGLNQAQINGLFVAWLLDKLPLAIVTSYYAAGANPQCLAVEI